MIVDVLLSAEDSSSPHRRPCVDWLTEALNGPTRIGLPWPSLLAFLRIRTHPRLYERPLDITTAWSRVQDWLAAPAAWVPAPTQRHADVLDDLVRRHLPTADLVPDVHLAALAIEHGVGLCSSDSDFARFSGLRWFNPLAE
ncbi:type II toxin-antitoxin system VapC family toxin [Nocardioides hungaricus]